MPRVSPIPGIHYAQDRFGTAAVPDRVRFADDADAPPARVVDLTDVACPPYDVISDVQRQSLLARHERNAVRVEFSAEPDPHAAAAEALGAWLADGTLERRGEPAVYYYRHGTASAPD